VRFTVEDPATSNELVVKNGLFEGPWGTSTPRMEFTTAGYTGTAELWYAVVEPNDPANYSDYTSLGSLPAGIHTGQPIKLDPGQKDILVLAYKDGMVSAPWRIKISAKSEALGEVDMTDVYDDSGPDLKAVLGVTSVKDAIKELHRRLNNEGSGRPFLDGLQIGMYLDLAQLDDGGATPITDDGNQNLRIVIASFNQYQNTMGNGAANHIKFVFKNSPVQKSMRTTHTNAGGYPTVGSDMVLRPYLENAFFSGLKKALEHDYFYTVTRNITAGIQNGWYRTPFSAAIFLDTETEVVGSSLAESENELTQTALYKFPGWTTKKFGSSNTEWWLASPEDTSTDMFCTVSNFGYPTKADAGDSYGVAPAFCIY
jgi:hypothetical protein